MNVTVQHISGYKNPKISTVFVQEMITDMSWQPPQTQS